MNEVNTSFLNKNSNVIQGYNSYGDKKHRILRVLSESDRPLSPKEIAFLAKINRSTTRVYLRQLLTLGEVSQPSHGFYVIKPRVGVPFGFGVRVHGLCLVVEAGFLRGQPKIGDVKERVGDVCFEVRFGRENGKISGFVSCEPPGLDYNGFCFVMDRFFQIVYEKTGFRVREFETVNVEFNEDYLGVQLDGLKSVTVRDFMGNMERIYNKAGGIRSEVRFPSGKVSLPEIYTLLKGGTTPYNIYQGLFVLLRKFDDLRDELVRAIKFGNEVNYRILTFLQKTMEER